MASVKNGQATSANPKWLNRVWWFASIIGILAILGTVGLATFVGWNLTHPVHFTADKLPESLGLSYENVEFTSSDQVKLDGWLFRSSAPSPKLIVFAHGYSNNRSYEEGALPTVQALLDAGYNCLMFDFRNHGLSEGNKTSIGQFEKLDLLAAIEYGKSLGYEHFGFVGYSMGAATSILAAAESQAVEAVVLDSPFADLRPYLEANLSYWSNLPEFPFTPLVMWVTPMIIGADLSQVRPIESIENLRGRGVLLIHAKGDTAIPSENSKLLYQAIGESNAELYLTDATQHVGSYAVDPTTYEQKVIALFDAHLK